MVNRVDSSTLIVDSAIKNESHIKTRSKETKVHEEDQALNSEELSASIVQTMADSMNQFLTSADSYLKFVFHEELSEYYVTIVDTETDEVIKEIPAKKLMDIHAAMKEFLGVFIDRKI